MRVHLIAVPFDTAIRGWRMGTGPEHLLNNGLDRYLAQRGHNVTTSVVTPKDGPGAEIATGFELMALVADEVRKARSHAFPLVLSGNCSTASGTLSGLTPSKRAIFWFDAHGDSNTPDTTITGFLDGMALATAMGWCWHGLTAGIPGFEPVDPRSVVLLGTRDVDHEEAALLDGASVRRVSPRDVPGPTLDEAITGMSDGLSAYVHVDLDVLDPDVVGQANVFPVPGGLSVESVERAIDKIGAAMPIEAAAITAYAPEFDRDGRIREAAFQVIDAILSAASRYRDAGSRANAKMA